MVARFLKIPLLPLPCNTKLKDMKILLLGSGGREHALAHKLAQSPLCEVLYIAPGNPGTAQHGQNIELPLDDFAGLAQFAERQNIDLVVVGPEAPLVAGLADFFARQPGLQHIAFIGPNAVGAQLEGSKDFAKQFMLRHQIPTAAHRTFSAKQTDEGLQYLAKAKLPIVLKADGLAAGKGVVICHERQKALAAFRQMLDGQFGEAGKKIVVEEFLQGREFSVFVLTDGQRYALLPVAKDHKRIGEGDTGPNTGGMGAVSPVPFVDEDLMRKVKERIIQPTIDGLQKEQIPYLGFIFFGLMEVQGEPYVIEYNCRLGDPETEAILPRLEEDLVQLMIEAAKQIGRFGQHADRAVRCLQSDLTATTVVLASAGYPGPYTKGIPISDLEKVKDCLVFQAGTCLRKGQLCTNGGRVIALTALAQSLEEARQKALKAAEQISFEGKYYRKDIGI